ncbi:MAG: serine/threonine-protein kinase [Pseudomonadota bacterium]
MVQAEAKPSLFGKYELLERLAVGGMAEIFLARSMSLGGVVRTCVIKRILPQHCANRHFVSMFIDEARIMIGLDHPNVVKLLDFGQIAGSYFMALEYVNGFDLVTVLRKVSQAGNGVAPLAAAYLVRGMASGLHHAHCLCDHLGRRLGVVHRDISPHNVLISFVGDVKITDFGIAQAKNKLTHTMPGTVMGKFAYMSPEQAMAEEIDHRSDLFSLGVVLHEMLSGQRLFGADSPVQTITKVLEATIEPPSWINAGVPSVLDQVTMKALKRDVQHRFQSGAEMAQSLEAYLQQNEYDQSSFADYLGGLDLAEERERLGRRRREPTVQALVQDTGVERDPRLVELRQQLAREPNLWTLVDIGERLLAVDERVRALSTLRVAAYLFAHRGLLVQAVVALEPIRHLCDDEQREDDLRTLVELRVGTRGTLLDAIQHCDGGEAWEWMRQADPQGLGADDEEATVLPAPAPLLGYVEADDFVRLVDAARIRHLRIGELAVREGEEGDALFAVGRGRVVVYCSPPDSDSELGDDGRIYLSSLSEGDFFGEFSFLTGSPRTATVEAITDAWVFELKRAAADPLVDLTPEIAGALLDFYKERVAELLMAKSPVFAVLEPHQRKVLLAQAVLVTHDDDEIVVHEGSASDSFFFIKHGEVEVFSERDGVPIFLNKLVEGDFFGEIGVIQEQPRMASVRSIGDVELLRIERRQILQVMSKEPRVGEALLKAASSRREQSAQIIAEHVELLGKL